MTNPSVSIVIEAGSSPDFHEQLNIVSTIESLLQQKYGGGSLELIISSFGWPEEAKETIRRRFPTVCILSNSSGGYYRLKNAGVRAATGDIIAFADADCRYDSDWVEQFVGTIQRGADVSVGFTVLDGRSLLHRLCGYYDLNTMLLRTAGIVRRFNSNNVAFRADLIHQNKYDEKFDRSGGCVQLAERLLRNNVAMVFNQHQSAVHRYYGFSRHSWVQAFCCGYDVFHTRAVDPKMPLASVVRLRWVAPPILAGIFVTADLWNFVQNRSLLRIRWYGHPMFILFSFAVRVLEIIGMYWTLLHPKSIAAFEVEHFA